MNISGRKQRTQKVTRAAILSIAAFLLLSLGEMLIANLLFSLPMRVAGYHATEIAYWTVIVLLVGAASWVVWSARPPVVALLLGCTIAGYLWGVAYTMLLAWTGNELRASPRMCELPRYFDPVRCLGATSSERMASVSYQIAWGEGSVEGSIDLKPIPYDASCRHSRERCCRWNGVGFVRTSCGAIGLKAEDCFVCEVAHSGSQLDATEYGQIVRFHDGSMLLYSGWNVPRERWRKCHELGIDVCSVEFAGDRPEL